jgi:hypothetical protein
MFALLGKIVCKVCGPLKAKEAVLFQLPDVLHVDRPSSRADDYGLSERSSGDLKLLRGAFIDFFGQVVPCALKGLREFVQLSGSERVLVLYSRKHECALRYLCL